MQPVDQQGFDERDAIISHSLGPERTDNVVLERLIRGVGERGKTLWALCASEDRPRFLLLTPIEVSKAGTVNRTERRELIPIGHILSSVGPPDDSMRKRSCRAGFAFWRRNFHLGKKAMAEYGKVKEVTTIGLTEFDGCPYRFVLAE